MKSCKLLIIKISVYPINTNIDLKINMTKYLLFFIAFLYTLITFGKTTEEYIREYKDIAIKEMNRVGIPASITLAQGILESGSGNSTLAVKANNHFGIKCHNTWNGAKVYHDDDKKGECFRKYRTAYDSYTDHSDFLNNASRYSSLFDLKVTDYKGWARGLKKAGYATARDYDKQLIHIIEKYELYKYDKTQKAKFDPEPDKPVISSGHEVKLNNNIKYILVKKGDTYNSISYEFGLMKWQLAKYNDINPESKLNPGSMLYLQPKRKKASIENKYHIVKEGENMYYISQKYGIKLDELYRKNLMIKGDQPKTGDKIYLRKRKKGEMPVSAKQSEEEEIHENSQDLEFLFE